LYIVTYVPYNRIYLYVPYTCMLLVDDYRLSNSLSIPSYTRLHNINVSEHSNISTRTMIC